MDQLPIDKFRKTIEDSIAKHPVTIITAETGAGKSTRVPLWMHLKGKTVHVTQPRRIAARSLSLYLAGLTKTKLGGSVGYQTGFDSQQSKQTSLLYVTDGVQMVREIKHRRDYDVLILDEVHEWNLNQEVLVGMVKQNLKRSYLRRTGKRVVIMSATLQANRLSAFLGKAPVISVPGRGYPVAFHNNDPRFLLPDTAQMVELGCNTLVFQPGKKEIETFMDDLKRMLDAEKMKAKILPLHAELSLKDQARVFDHYPIPKVVVATDIAQTSLTIDDIDAVVDSGIKKEVRIVRGIEGLYPVDISAAECKQRAGRAGRVRKGQYFLCADADVSDRMPFPEPEIQRLNLESVVLRLIKMGISPLEFPFFHSPSKALIHKAIKQLKLLGAIREEGDDEKKQHTVTPDGTKMAELPVSLRSARLLLEAQKGSNQVVDSALKCIAILETKGIVTKEYGGEKLANIPYNSDLLNQLVLWHSARMYRQIISHKKLALAKEIYYELKKRIKLPPVKKHLSLKDMDVLFRAVLSCFADEVMVRGGDEYMRGESEVRQLDRTSILFQAKPEMITGLPFDLVINRENRDTGEIEPFLISLITFASELTLEYLENLKPFSFYKNEKYFIQNNKIQVYREFYFGGKLIASLTSAPNWSRKEEKEKAADVVFQWYEENKEIFPLTGKLENIGKDFEEIATLVTVPLKSFDYYRRSFLLRELRKSLNMEDLELFFNIHKGFHHIHLKRLLPFRVIKELSRQEWPKFIQVGEEQIEVCYTGKGKGKKAFIQMDHVFFDRVDEEDLLLPTGEWAGVKMGEQTCHNWVQAVEEFNRWKKTDLFERKYKGEKKPGHMEDLMEVPFPQVFEAGQGKDKKPFEYYIAPEIDGEDVYLVHFFHRHEAEAYFDSVKENWDLFVKRYKKRKLENIFKQKGWKVR